MRRLYVTAALAAAAVLLLAAESGATVKPGRDQCSNLRGVQRKIPSGYKRGANLKCIRKPVAPPNCTSDELLGADGKCHTIPPPLPSPPPAPTPVAWWPTGYTGWVGAGNAVATNGDIIVAYAPSSCPAIGGAIANGQTDSLRRICWAYTIITNVRWRSSGKTGCGSLFATVQETSNGVIVGHSIDSETDIPNGQPVLMHDFISPNGQKLDITLSSIDCFSP